MCEKYGKGKNWIRGVIDRAPIRKKTEISGREIVCVFDATHIGEDVLLSARAPEIKANLGWAWIEYETKDAYAGLRSFVESKGFQLKAVVLDGRTGIPRVFQDIPVQICHFHQQKIVKRKLTLRPETEAGQELLSIAFLISKINEKTLRNKLDLWLARYETFINERAYPLGTNRWHYTHRRVRAAYQSLRRNLPFLYAYQKYPGLNIPNTTNSLDGYWSRIKNLLAAHRGKSRERVRKIVAEILRKQTA